MLIKEFITLVLLNKFIFITFVIVAGWVMLNIWAPDQIGEANLTWQSGTEFTGTLRHKNTEEQAWIFPRTSSGIGTVALEDNRASFTNKNLSNFRFNNPEINNMVLNQIIIRDIEPLPVNSGGTGVTDLDGFFNIEDYSGNLLNRHFADESIETNAIANRAISEIKIQDRTVSIEDIGEDVSAFVEDGSITSEFIEDGAVTTEKFSDEAITTEKFIDNSISLNKIVDGSLLPEDFISEIFNTGQFSNNSIITSKIINNAIQTRHLQDGIITTDKILDETIEIDDISFVPEPRTFYVFTNGKSLTTWYLIFPKEVNITEITYCWSNNSGTAVRMLLQKTSFRLVLHGSAIGDVYNLNTSAFMFCATKNLIPFSVTVLDNEMLTFRLASSNEGPTNQNLFTLIAVEVE